MGKYLKAIIAFLVGGLGSIGTAMTPDPDGVSRLTWPEIVTSISVAIAASAAVGIAKNAGTVYVDKLPDAVTLAREAYETYAQAVGGRAVNGDLLPAWEQVTAIVKDAWTRAQNAVVSLLRQ